MANLLGLSAYLLFSYLTFKELDPRTIWEREEHQWSLIARFLLGATWPLIWFLVLANKLTVWVLSND